MGLPQWLRGKESAAMQETQGPIGSMPGLGRSPGGRPGNPLQNSGLENPIDREGWQPTVHSVAESDMIEATEDACTDTRTNLLQGLAIGCC